MASKAELSPADLEGGFALIRDFDPIYDHFDLRSREATNEINALRGEMQTALSRAVGNVLSIELAQVHALPLPVDESQSYIVSLDGGILFPSFDYRIEITRACSSLSEAVEGPYMRLSRQFAPLLNQQAITLQRAFQLSKKSGVVLCDDGIGTGKTFKRIIVLCRDLDIPVSDVVALTNPSGLQEIEGVKVHTLDPERSGLAWLNERDLYWGLPRSGISISEQSQFRSIGGVPYTLNEQMAHNRIGIPSEHVSSFVEEALEINERFIRLHEDVLKRPIVYQEVSRLYCLLERGAVQEARVTESLTRLRQSHEYRSNALRP